MSDELKAVPGFEGQYAVTADGRVWSYASNRWLKPQRNKQGYMEVQLGTPRLHRIVAAAWLPNPKNLPVVNHKDGNKQNNVASNLEWCTVGDNTRHAFRMGLIPKGCPPHPIRKGERRAAKLTPDQVITIRARLAAGEEGKSLAAEYGVTQPNISILGRGKTWRT